MCVGFHAGRVTIQRGKSPTALLGDIKHEMAKGHLKMLDTVNPYNYLEQTTFNLVIHRLTGALLRLTVVLFLFHHFVF